MIARADNLHTDALAIVEKYEAFVRYLYPILQTSPRKHGVLRDKVLDLLFEPIGGLYHAAKSKQISERERIAMSAAAVFFIAGIIALGFLLIGAIVGVVIFETRRQTPNPPRMSDLEYRIGKLSLAPGDVLVVKLAERMCNQHAVQRLRGNVREMMPSQKVLVISNDADLSVLTQTEIAERTA